jgi:hypothetical protein
MPGSGGAEFGNACSANIDLLYHLPPDTERSNIPVVILNS